MRHLRLFAVLVPALALSAGVFAPVRAGAEEWQKTYPITTKASLTVITGDVPIELRGCAECHAVKIVVDWKDRNPSDFLLKESQAGDMVDFELGEKVKWGIHFGLSHSPHVTVETPANLDLQARTSDGSLKVLGVQGDIRLHGFEVIGRARDDRWKVYGTACAHQRRKPGIDGRGGFQAVCSVAD